VQQQQLKTRSERQHKNENAKAANKNEAKQKQSNKKEAPCLDAWYIDAAMRFVALGLVLRLRATSMHRSYFGLRARNQK
jgi:type VI protein secretion system component VasF